LNFHSVFVIYNRFTNLSLTLGAGKKGIETFRQPTQAAEMKGQAPVIKSPWAAIDFFLASITLTPRRNGHGLSTECTNIDEANLFYDCCVFTEC